MKAPFPYFGGKSKAAPEVWRRFGSLQNYVEPFAGSAAMLLKRPRSSIANPNHNQDWGIETINDADGLVSNFWRSMRYDIQGLIHHANWPVNEADLHARHLWLVRKKDDLTDRLMADPEWYDVKAAGWWVWGACSWIGSGWCSGNGPWSEINGRLVKTDERGTNVNRQVPHLGDAGMGVNRQVPHLGDAGRGGEYQVGYHLTPLAERLRNVRVACGDWLRVLGPTPTYRLGLTGVFLDPPYSEGTIDYNAGDRTITHEVRKWCIENGSHPKLRIALCGYDNEHNELEDLGWAVHKWEAHGGYGSQGDGAGRDNAKRERIWFSPGCQNERLQTVLF